MENKKDGTRQSEEWKEIFLIVTDYKNEKVTFFEVKFFRWFFVIYKTGVSMPKIGKKKKRTVGCHAPVLNWKS